MKHFLASLLILICTGYTFSQSVYFVSFTDKDYSDSTIARNTLSERSIERRLNQNIELDSLDFPVKPEYIDSILKIGGILKHTSKWMNGVLLNNLDSNLSQTISSLNFVEYIHNLSTSNTGGISSVEGETTIFGSTTELTDFLELEHYYDQDLFGQNIHISFFDAGFPGLDTLKAFQHLFLNSQIQDQHNLVENNKEVFKSNGHGTTVASVILGLDTNNFIGVAPLSNASFYITEDINSETIEEEYNWLIAAEKADSSGTDIINSSLGYINFDIDSLSHTFSQLDGQTAIISRAAQIASNKGILVVNSAGNSGNSSSWPQVAFPADNSQVLTVGSIDYQGNRSSFSSFGEINGNYQKPEIVAPASSIAVIKEDGSIAKTSGTSFSAPVIAGYCVLLWQQNPHLTSQDLKLEITSMGHLASNPTEELGYGYPTLHLNGINESLSTKKNRVEYYNLNGQEIDLNNTSGIFIIKTFYSNGKIKREKGYKLR